MTAKDKLDNYHPAETISPSLPTAPHRFSLHLAAGTFCFVLALLFYYGAVLRIDLKQTSFLDLGPGPDAVEYFAQANSILRYGVPTIQIGYDKLPSRYPPGYPILMIPWLKVLPQRDMIFAPFRTNQTIGLLLLLGCFALYLRIGRPLAGGLAALLLATQPAFVTYSRSSMSDLSCAAAAVLAFALVYLGLASRRRWPIYCAAVVLGLSLFIRPQLLFFAPLLISMALFPVFRSRAKWLLHCVLVILTFALAASPYFILNTFEFGHPLKTGYDFWVPWFTEKQKMFSVHHIPRQLAMIWSEVTASWDEFRVANLFGTGTYVVPTFVLLSAIGLAFLQFTRFEISALLAGTVFFVATTTYRFFDGRFYMPILFLLVPLAVLPVEWAIRRSFKSRYSFLGVAALALFVLSCVGYPSQSGFKPETGRSQAWDAIKYANGNGKSVWYEAQENFIRFFRIAPGIVLSDIDPPYLNVLLPRPFIAAPIDDNHNYRFSQLWHYGKAEAIRLVQGALDHATPVYALLIPSENIDQEVKRLPEIQGYSWKRSKKSDKSAIVMTLTKDAAASTLDSASRSVEMPNEAVCTYSLLQ
jgi:4-amino-4-deoxy-L-arabinose transferase-like glycosyltransferase